MKILLAGPWIGEFGWELFCWQGYIRKLSLKYDKTIVIGRPGNNILYEDFCDEYIDFDPEGWETDGWRCYNSTKEFDITSVKHTDHVSGKLDLGYLSEDKTRFFNEQTFYKYTSKSQKEHYDILFHCRNKSTGSERNWNEEQWNQLFNLLPNNLKIACIGNEQSFYVKGTDDLRCIKLNDLIRIMCNSQIIVGPSSGPMHLASLAGLKHLVWSSSYNFNRYTKDWNPFKTKVIFYDKENWNPEPQNISELILKNI